MPRRAPRLLTALALTLVGATLAACGDDDRADLPDLPVIQQAWELRDVDVFVAGTYWTRPAVWSTADLLVATSADHDAMSTTLRSIDRDGTVQWTTDLEGFPCSTSDQVGDDGTAALRLSSSRDQLSCDQLVAFDTATGTVRWQAELGALDGPYEPRTTVGAVVSTSGACGRVLRFALADGAPLREVQTYAGDRPCRGVGAFADDLVLAQPRRENADGRPTRSVLLDDSFAERWSTPRPVQATDVVSTDPLVVEAVEGPHRFLRRYDDAGRPGPPIGYDLGYTAHFRTIAHDDRTLVGAYDDAEVVHAFDLDTGELLWTRSNDRFGSTPRLLGEHDGRLVWGQPADVDQGEEGYPSDQYWITLTDLRDPTRGSTLGRLQTDDGQSGPSLTVDVDLAYVAGDLLLVPGYRFLAFDLTADTEGGSAPDGVSLVPPDRWAGVSDTDQDWAGGDVRPTEALRACTTVAPTTLDLLGLDGDLPAPISCSWYGGGAGTLAVRVTVAEGGTFEDGERTASENAARSMDGLDDTEARVVAVDGLGDAAFVADGSLSDRLGTAGPASAPTAGRSRVVVRRANVLVDVDASGFTGVAPSTVRRAALLAATDVLAGVGLDVAPPAPGTPGPVTGVGTACADLAPARGLADGPGREIGPGGEVNGCRWGTTSDGELVLVAEAVEPRPTGGVDAVTTASQLMTADDVTEVPGLGDEAWAALDESYGATTVLLAARRDNLVVTARYSAYDDASSERRQRQVEALVRQALEPGVLG
ncbi:PQQ-binding-like beta-propeller repeat protein [Nocardioides sp. C4-1]|uniref:outer membrane protein assembly factor BamB family protein n=1 Tax=Nocardioides sp. C4-1 TaxID=3151851 RepID=UPI0032635C0A